MTRVWEPGTRIDGFRIDGLFHSGGMAVIYRVTPAVDPGFPVVMKVPRLGHGEPAEGIVGFEVEQMVLGALTGPHVPKLVAKGNLERVPYLVMEEVQGRPLKDWTERAPIEPEEAARLGAALATALHSLHMQEVVHLDIKPSNVVIRSGGEAVLVDFGLAHHAHYPDLLAEELLRPLGSAPYIAPEQVMRVRSDPRSDIFAVGVTLYELATGRLPFGSPASVRGLRRRLYQDAIPPRAHRAAIPEWLQEIILRCLEIDSSRRYASAAQLAFDLSHPHQVTITERGKALRGASLATRFKRWVRAAGFEPPPCPQPSAYLAGVPIVLAAIATHHTNQAQSDALREAVSRAVTKNNQTRLACVTVIRPTPVMGGATEQETATSIHLSQLVQLRHWAAPLALPAERVSFHVLESADPAHALVEYARANHVDEIIMGAPPPPMPLGSLLSTVASRIAVEAPCTVTLVRAGAVRLQGAAPRDSSDSSRKTAVSQA